MRSLLLILALSGCAPKGMRLPGPLDTLGQAPESGAPSEVAQGGREQRRAERSASRAGLEVARAAVGFLGADRLSVDGERYAWDCSGLVAAAYARAGIALRGSSADLYALSRELGVLHHRKRPLPGDVAFFDDTYDRNGNGRRDDELSHVAIVEAVDADGTITLVHKGNKGVVRTRMNLGQPDVARTPEGALLNDVLRAGTRGRGASLTGELWRAFGSLWKADPARVEQARGAVASRD